MADDCRPILPSFLPRLQNPSVGDVIFAIGDKLHTTSLEGLLSQFDTGSLRVIYLNTPASSLTSGRYQVIEAGTYTNVNPNITVTEQELLDNWVYISVGSVSIGGANKQLVSKPQGKQEIAKWSNDIGLMYPEVRTHNEGIWRVIDGQTTINVDEPEDGSTVWEKIADITDVARFDGMDSLIMAIQNDIINLGNNKQDRLTQGLNITILNGVISAKDTVYSLVTITADGLMSKEDKIKLDALPDVAISEIDDNNISLNTSFSSDYMLRILKEWGISDYSNRMNIKTPNIN